MGGKGQDYRIKFGGPSDAAGLIRTLGHYSCQRPGVWARRLGGDKRKRRGNDQLRVTASRRDGASAHRLGNSGSRARCLAISPVGVLGFFGGAPVRPMTGGDFNLSSYPSDKWGGWSFGGKANGYGLSENIRINGIRRGW